MPDDSCGGRVQNSHLLLVIRNSQIINLLTFLPLTIAYILYVTLMILSFRHKGFQCLFEKADRSKVTAQDVQKLKHILAVLNHATKPEDMSLPGFHLHPLKGRLKDF
ncbi:MAG: type II toxin-antitoxin system RelE/ParE family toxin [Candidatus Scalindua sp.]